MLQAPKVYRFPWAPISHLLPLDYIFLFCSPKVCLYCPPAPILSFSCNSFIIDSVYQFFLCSFLYGQGIDELKSMLSVIHLDLWCFLNQTHYLLYGTKSSPLSATMSCQNNKTGAFYFGFLPWCKTVWLKSQLEEFAMLDHLCRKCGRNLMYQCNGLLPSLWSCSLKLTVWL